MDNNWMTLKELSDKTGLSSESITNQFDKANYQPFSGAGTMLPPSPEMIESLQYNNPEEDDERSITEQLYALNEDHGHDHIPDTDDLDLPKLVAPSVEFMEDLQDDAEYATYDDKTTDVDAPANVNEDNELPPYSIFARYWQTEKPLKYPRIPKCGHKFRAEFEPNHRNCESCWFTYFQVHGELTKAVEEAYQTGGAELIKKLRGPKFLDNFLKFMSTVALIKRQQEEAVKVAAKETDESITGFGNSIPIGENGSEGFATLDSAETAQP